ncbi:VOC family protein [Nocardioides sp. S-58]|uniref:VOC family protein n=1 Tax=Nocardioides renjunii TaxID=3095075 RepID=A0ABU5K8D5_9ACTN|nr:VOC family protein [Nocardioides sp. S-58]MDZ5661230.1 VOC family protein [Nocardioides sp. S-58]
MSLVTWQDLCLDALDVERMSRFWAAVGGLEVADPEPPASLRGPTSGHTVWVNPVDRPRRAKNRVHLDVDCGAVEDLVALGATVTARAEDTGLGWTRMADPEGNDFCAFVRPADRLPDYRLHGIGVDCHDPEAQARWWGELFGADPTRDDELGTWTLTGVAVDEQMTLDFNGVPEPRTEPNRVHWDVRGDVGALLARGATHLWDMPRWTVLADPEGNEFCVFPPG